MPTIFKELIIICDPESVFEYLQMHYCDNKTKKFAGVIDDLISITPETSEYTICIKDEDEYVRVFGTKNGSDNDWCLSMFEWSEWLGMEIHETSQAMFNKDEIVCHCLWEMTYFGFDEEKIREFKEKLLLDDEEMDKYLDEDDQK